MARVWSPLLLLPLLLAVISTFVVAPAAGVAFYGNREQGWHLANLLSHRAQGLQLTPDVFDSLYLPSGEEQECSTEQVLGARFPLFPVLGPAQTSAAAALDRGVGAAATIALVLSVPDADPQNGSQLLSLPGLNMTWDVAAGEVEGIA